MLSLSSRTDRVVRIRVSILQRLAYRAKGSSQLGVLDIILGSTL
jgi:hypothetical protein